MKSPKFQQRHYENIALWIRMIREEVFSVTLDDDKTRVAVARIVGNMAREMAGDNPRFNRARFMKACGIIG